MILQFLERNFEIAGAKNQLRVVDHKTNENFCGEIGNMEKQYGNMSVFYGFAMGIFCESHLFQDGRGGCIFIVVFGVSRKIWLPTNILSF